MTIGGGAESMSRVGIGASGGAWPVDPSIAVATYFLPQGISADLIATKYGFSRDDVDAYAVESQKRTAKSWDEGRFKNSVIAVKDCNGLTILAKDEHMRPSTTMQTLAALAPSFVQMGEMGGFDAVAVQRYPEVETINHVHTPGNSSGIVDGAAAVLIGSKEAGQAAGLKPRARIRAFANVGSEPAIMLTGPIPVTEKVLKKAGMAIGDIDLFELNEAFASVVLRYMQAFDIPHDKMNVNGGAIAMGHPLGATGAMILGTVLDELERRDLSTALVTLCIGIGMGTATIIERVVRRMPKIDIAKVPVDDATRLSATVRQGRWRALTSKRLGDAIGLTQFGVNLCTLKPGAASAQRHWHEKEDEFSLHAGRRAGAVRGRRRDRAQARRRRRPEGRQRRSRHRLVNRSDRDAVFFEVGTRATTERVHYSGHRSG